MEHKHTTFGALKRGDTFQFPGNPRRFFVKIAGGFKGIEGGALHSCPDEQTVQIA